jgi:HIV Tat-specific factor 1
LGEVTNVVLFDKEPAGVASVRFANASAAEACVQLMNDRWFDERQLEAHISTGKEKFRRSDDKKAAVNFEDSESEEDVERAEKFGEFLEAET